MVQIIIVTFLGSIVVFGIPTAFLLRHSRMRQVSGEAGLTYVSGLLWFLSVGGLGFLYVLCTSGNAHIDIRVGLYAEMVGVFYLYAFIFYFFIGIPIFIVSIIRRNF